MGVAERVDAAVDSALGERIVGTVVLMSENGERTYTRAAGMADREGGVPVRQNTIFRLASVTKPIIATAVLRLFDLGELSPDDPVTRFLPFFAPRAPDGSTPRITIHDLLTHTSGIAYGNLPDNVSRGSDPGNLIPLEENLRRLAASPLAFSPGARWEYGMSIDVLGGVIGAINGNVSDVEAAMQRLVTGPLGMKDTHFVASDPGRLAVPYGDATPPFRMKDPQRMVARDGGVYTMSTSRILDPRAPQCGGTGMAGTAGDFLGMLESILFGGFLAPETRDAALTNRIGKLEIDQPGQSFGYLGAIVSDVTRSGWPRQGMMHWGGIWGNNWALDPATGTILVAFTNTMWDGCNGLFRDDLRDAVFG